MIKTSVVLSLLLSAAGPALLASGGSGSGSGGGGGSTTTPTTTTSSTTTAPVVPELRVFSETIPAGATVQLKFAFTEPTPIGTGTGSFDMPMMDGVWGVAATSPSGDAFGLARLLNGALKITLVSPSGTLGTNLDYPMLTVTGRVSPNALPGSQAQVGATSGITFLGPTGAPLNVLSKPGTLTVGGQLSIHNVVPGGGTWPAGTVLRIEGTGFGKGTTLKSKLRFRNVAVMSPNLILAQLDRRDTLDEQAIQVTNPDKTTVEYFSYLRGVDRGVSAYPDVAGVDAIYPAVSAGAARLTVAGNQLSGQVLTALAVQNPNTTAVTLKLRAESPFAGVIAQTEVVMQPGEEITRELGELFGRSLDAGVTVKANSDSALQFLGFTVDTASKTYVPFVPAAN